MNFPCFLEPDFGTQAPDITEQSFPPNLRKVLNPRDAYAEIPCSKAGKRANTHQKTMTVEWSTAPIN